MLRLDPRQPAAPRRDRFILSKGHCAAALYSTLALRGFFPSTNLATFMQPLSALNGHPNRRKVPGVEANTGPLGHGLPIGVGCAVAAKLAEASWRTFVVLGDGELQEGSNWEAAMCAGHRQLDNLVAVVDRNRLQQGARTEDTNRLEPLADRWRAFGWETVECDGHDHAALYDGVHRSDERPSALRDRQDDQGQGRFVHRGSRRVASQGAVARTGRTRAEGAGVMDRSGCTPDRRRSIASSAFAETLIELAHAD